MSDRIFLQSLFLQPPALDTPLYISPRRCSVGGFGVWRIGFRVNGLGRGEWQAERASWELGNAANRVYHKDLREHKENVRNRGCLGESARLARCTCHLSPRAKRGVFYRQNGKVIILKSLQIGGCPWPSPGVNWKGILTDSEDKEALAALRLNTQTGRPLASDSFLSKLERTLGCRLRPLPVGRPKKEKCKTRKRRK